METNLSNDENIKNKMNYCLIKSGDQIFNTDPSLGCSWNGTTFELKKANEVSIEIKTQTKEDDAEDTLIG